MVEVAPPADRMPRSASTHSGLLAARMAPRSPFLNPRLSRPQAMARTRCPAWPQVIARHSPPRRPDMASESGVVAARCWNMWTTERNAGSLIVVIAGNDTRDPARALLSVLKRKCANFDLSQDRSIAFPVRFSGAIPGSVVADVKANPRADPAWFSTNPACGSFRLRADAGWERHDREASFSPSSVVRRGIVRAVHAIRAGNAAARRRRRPGERAVADRRQPAHGGAGEPDGPL